MSIDKVLAEVVALLSSRERKVLEELTQMGGEERERWRMAIVNSIKDRGPLPDLFTAPTDVALREHEDLMRLLLARVASRANGYDVGGPDEDLIQAVQELKYMESEFIRRPQ